MYIDYSKWETFTYSLNTLQLDVNNPRIRYRGVPLNQTQIMKFLIKNEKVYDLAKKISEEGYFVNEDPIICIENDKKVVLEGNRRTAALKLLQNPTKYLSRSKAAVLVKNIKENDFPVNKKLKCFIAPNRLMANPIIYERHQGASLERWKSGNQYAFVAELYYEDGLSIESICDVLNITKSRVLKPLRAYNLFMEGQYSLKKLEKIDVNLSDFDITNLERFYGFEEGRELLGVSFDEDTGELLINLPEDEFRKRLVVVFKEILYSENFSREFNKSEDKNKLIQKLKSNPSINLSRRVDSSPKLLSVSSTKRKDLDAQKSKIVTRKNSQARKTRRTKPKDSLFGRSLSLKHGKVNDMYRFLDDLYTKHNKDETALQIIGMSLRLLLEVAARVYFTEINSEIAKKDMVYKDFLNLAKKDLVVEQKERNYLALTHDWLNSTSSIEGLLGKYAHGNILVNKNDIVTSSKIVGDILEYYFSKNNVS